MNPRVEKYAASAGFDAAKYKWFDLVDLRDAFDKDERERHAFYISSGLENITIEKIQDVPLPFESIACVFKGKGAGGATEHLLFTIDRTPTKLEFKAWETRQPSQLWKITLTIPPEGTAPPPNVDTKTWGHVDGTETFVDIKIREDFRAFLLLALKDTYRVNVTLMAMVSDVLDMFFAVTSGFYNKTIPHLRLAGTPKGDTSNVKRKKKGKKLLYTWTTVTIKDSYRGDGTRVKRKPPKPPRQHDVMGHWATSPKGKKFFRRAHVRGTLQEGIVKHDYIVKVEKQNERHQRTFT